MRIFTPKINTGEYFRFYPKAQNGFVSVGHWVQKKDHDVYYGFMSLNVDQAKKLEELLRVEIAKAETWVNK